MSSIWQLFFKMFWFLNHAEQWDTECNVFVLQYLGSKIITKLYSSWVAVLANTGWAPTQICLLNIIRSLLYQPVSVIKDQHSILQKALMLVWYICSKITTKCLLLGIWPWKTICYNYLYLTLFNPLKLHIPFTKRNSR